MVSTEITNVQYLMYRWSADCGQLYLFPSFFIFNLSSISIFPKFPRNPEYYTRSFILRHNSATRIYHTYIYIYNLWKEYYASPIIRSIRVSWRTFARYNASERIVTYRESSIKIQNSYKYFSNTCVYIYVCMYVRMVICFP